MRKVYIKLHLLLFFVLIYPSKAENLTSKIFSSNLIAKVIGIKDGDTIEVYLEGKSVIIRLAHIDCPEKKQPFGTVAKTFTSNKCFGQIVTIINGNKLDRNKRIIAEIINDKGENINKELVKAGLAWHYKKYSLVEEYAILETTAKRNKLGLWYDKNPIPPWNWRI